MGLNGVALPVILTHAPRLAALAFFTYLTLPIWGQNGPLFLWHPFLMTLSFAVCLPGGLSFLQPCLAALPFLGFRIGYVGKVSIQELFIESFISLSLYLLYCKINVITYSMAIFINFKVRFHWIAMTLASVLGSCGVAVIYYNKILNNKPHFTSWHGLFGILTIVIFAAQALGGIFVLYPAAAMGVISRKFVKKFHFLGGSAVALMGYFSLLLGLYSNWFVGKVSGWLWYIFVAPLIYWSFTAVFYNLRRLIR